MRRSLMTAFAALALVTLAACGGPEDAATDMPEEMAPPPVDTMMADTTMMDTMATTTGM